MQSWVMQQHIDAELVQLLQTRLELLVVLIGLVDKAFIRVLCQIFLDFCQKHILDLLEDCRLHCEYLLPVVLEQFLEVGLESLGVYGVQVEDFFDSMQLAPNAFIFNYFISSFDQLLNYHAEFEVVCQKVSKSIQDLLLDETFSFYFEFARQLELRTGIVFASELLKLVLELLDCLICSTLFKPQFENALIQLFELFICILQFLL